LADPGIDEQHIEPTEGLAHGLRHLLLRRDIAGVGADRQHVVAELGARRLERLRVRPRDRHTSSLGEELARRLQADAAAAARDQRALALESVHDTSPSDLDGMAGLRIAYISTVSANPPFSSRSTAYRP